MLIVSSRQLSVYGVGCRMRISLGLEPLSMDSSKEKREVAAFTGSTSCAYRHRDNMSISERSDCASVGCAYPWVLSP